MESEWNRVSTKHPCKICGKPDWCLLSADQTAAICPRTPSEKYIDGSGYLHVLDKSKPMQSKGPTRKPTAKALPEHNSVMEMLMKGFWEQADDDRVSGASSALNLSIECLRTMEIGYSVSQNAYAFPMRRSGNRFLGIRFRTSSGQKFAAKGSKQGLFIPKTFHRKQAVVVCEGPTDTAAMVQLGFNAIGRPSCNAGSMLIKELARGLPVAILADNDQVGLDGANKLADQLVKSDRSRPRVSIVGCNGHKDAREWVASGATRQDIMEAIRRSR